MTYSPETVFQQLLNSSSENDELRQNAGQFIDEISNDYNFFEFLLEALKQDGLDENLYVLIPSALRICYRNIFSSLDNEKKMNIIHHMHELLLIPFHPSLKYLLLLYRQMRSSFVNTENYEEYDQFYQEVISRISFDVDSNYLNQLLSIVKDAIIDRYQRQLKHQISDNEMINARLMEFLSPVLPILTEVNFLSERQFQLIKKTLKIFHKINLEKFPLAKNILMIFFQNLNQLFPIQGSVDDPIIAHKFFSFLKQCSNMLYSIIASDFDQKNEDTGTFIEIAIQLLYKMVGSGFIDFEYLKPLLHIVNIHFRLLQVNQDLIMMFVHIITINDSDLQDLENNPMFFIDKIYTQDLEKTNSLDKTERDLVISILHNIGMRNKSVLSYLFTTDISEATIYLIAHMRYAIAANEMENALPEYIDRALAIGFEQNYEIASLNLLISQAIDMNVMNDKFSIITEIVAAHLSSDDPIIFNSILFVISSLLKKNINFGNSDNDVIERILEMTQSFPLEQADIVLFEFVRNKSMDDSEIPQAIFERMFDDMLQNVSAILESEDDEMQQEILLKHKSSALIAILESFSWSTDILDTPFFEAMDAMAKGSKSSVVEIFFDFAVSATEKGSEQEGLIQQFCAIYVDTLQNQLSDDSNTVMIDSCDKALNFLIPLLQVDQQAFDNLEMTETLFQVCMKSIFLQNNVFLAGDYSKLLSLLIQTTENIDIELIFQKTIEAYATKSINPENFSLIILTLIVYHPDVISNLTHEYITTIFNFVTNTYIYDNMREVSLLAFHQLFQINPDLYQEYSDVFDKLNTQHEDFTSHWPSHERFQALQQIET